MAQIVVVDPILLTEEYGLSPSWAGQGHHVVRPTAFDLDSLRPHLAAATVILTAHYPVDGPMMDAAPGLQLVAKPGTGVDNIDVAAAQRRGVTVTNAPGARGRAVAEHTLFMLLYLARHGWMHGDPAWKSTTGVQLGAKTLGVVGLGSIGSLLARFGDGLGMDIIAHTRTEDPDRAAGVPVRFVAKDELLRTADVVALCMPLTPQTRHYIDADSLRLMKPTAYLLNVSRGPTVATEDLLTAMASGHLAGAGLDVTDPEPLPPDHGLHDLSNVFITPHNAGRTHESQAMAMSIMLANVKAVLRATPPPNAVTPASAGSG